MGPKNCGGDLTTRLEVSRGDDIGQLQLLIRQLNINLSSIIGDIRDNFVAYTATYSAKQAGGDTYRFFTTQMNADKLACGRVPRLARFKLP